MKHLIVLLAACSISMAASAVLQSAPGEFWPCLAEMTPEERANSEVWIEPARSSEPQAYDEARAIGALWNSGEYEAAIERARGYSRFGDPSEVALAISPRKLTACEPGFGPDVRIGNRDSLYGLSFDRLNNGWLFASFASYKPDRTFIYSYRSTDNGTTWSNLGQFQWNYRQYVRSAAAVCHGDYLVVAIAIKGLSSHRCYAARLSATTGEVVPYPGDTVFTQVLEAAPGDTVVELAAASSEDQYPGSTIHLFARTSSGALKYALADSSAWHWQEWNTGVNTICHNGLDCTWNDGYDSKHVWASWTWYLDDTARLWTGHWEQGDSSFNARVFTDIHVHKHANPASRVPTSITAWRDTVQVAYPCPGGRQLKEAYTFDCDSGYWQTAALTDSGYERHSVEISARRGGGTAVTYYEDSPGYRDPLFFRYAPGPAGPWTEPDSVSEPDHGPYHVERSRVEYLGAGEYGMAWLSWDGSAAYFDRVSVTGIAEPEPPRPFRFQAMRLSGCVRLAFNNPAFGPVRVRVFDLAGKLRYSREEHLAAGRQEFDIVPEASGVYFTLVEAGGRRESTAFSFVR